MRKTAVLLTSAILLWAVPAISGGPKLGAKAPRFVCPLLNSDEAVSLKELNAKGQVVLMSFFHTTCKPCLKEIPKLSEIVKSKAGKPLSAYLVFVGTEDDAVVNEYLKKNGFTLPVLKDRYGLRVGEPYGVVENEMAHVPQIFVVSKNGIVKGKWSGFKEGMETELPALLDELCAEEKEAPSASGNLTILFTNNTNGMTAPAPGIEVGGLARRATVIKREKAAGTVLLFDGGDFMPTSPDLPRTRKVVAAMARMGYDAVAIGEAEFVNGLGYLRSLAGREALPLLSSNVKLCKGDACSDMVRSSKVIDAGKRKVAVFSCTDPDAFGFTPEERMKDGFWYVKLVDWKSPLKAFLDSKRKEVDLVVVISHAGVEPDRKLAEEFPDIDVIIGAHSQTFMTSPMIVGKTQVVQAAGNGQYVGKLVIRWNDDGKPAVESYELVPLTKAVAPDEDIKDLLAESAAAPAAIPAAASPPAATPAAATPPAGGGETAGKAGNPGGCAGAKVKGSK